MKAQPQLQQPEHLDDSELSAEDREYLDYIKVLHAQRALNSSLSEIVENLSVRLNKAAESGEVIRVYEDLSFSQRDAAEVLVQSGEAVYYREANNILCVRSTKPSLLTCLFSMGIPANCR